MYQKLILVGNLGRDPELKYTNSGIPIANFPVATNHKWTDPEGKTVEETIWFRIAVYGKQAEACNEFLSKGQKVLVEGALVADDKGGPRIYERKDGRPGASFEVRAATVRFLSAKGEGAPSKSAAAADPQEVEETMQEQVPF